jgi:hypothetical protein
LGGLTHDLFGYTDTKARIGWNSDIAVLIREDSPILQVIKQVAGQVIVNA